MFVISSLMKTITYLLDGLYDECDHFLGPIDTTDHPTVGKTKRATNSSISSNLPTNVRAKGNSKMNPSKGKATKNTSVGRKPGKDSLVKQKKVYTEICGQ